MTDTVANTAPAAAVVSSPAPKKSPTKKKLAVKAKNPAASHPATSVMVTSAIKELKEKKGSSLPAIKKYLAANYKVDPAKLAPFIRKFLKASVANGTVVQTKGTGASGHFKLSIAEVKPKKKAATVVKKKKPAVKKIKPAGTPKKKPTAAKKIKTTSGEPTAKKAKKTETSKPKTTKPKKSPTKAKKPVTAKPKTKKTPTKKIVAPKKK